MRDPITLPRNPSKSFIAANPDLYAPKKPADAKVVRGAAQAGPSTGSPLEEIFYLAWCAAAPDCDLEPRREYKFAPHRKWKFDFAWPAQRVFVELEGGVHSKGRHTRAAGFIADCEKYNWASFAGWVGFRLPTGGVTEEAVTQIQDFIRRR